MCQGQAGGLKKDHFVVNGLEIMKTWFFSTKPGLAITRKQEA